jgi:glycosyltransferase involved in cell wall biosynthesis
MNELKKATSSLPESMTVTLRGATPNARLLNEYALGAYDIFISMSSSEGIPVSVIEAMAYGIVPLCTDAGGTREAITPDVGVLLPLDVEYETFERGLTHIIKNWKEMSEKAIKRQRAYFSLQSNFAAFYRFVARLIH